MRVRTDVTWPIRPSSAACLAYLKRGCPRKGNDTTKWTPASAAARPMRSTSSTVSATTFSVKTCRRARKAARITSVCIRVGASTTTPSTSSRETAFSKSGSKGTPSFSAHSRPRASSSSQTTVIRALGCDWTSLAYPGAWTCQKLNIATLTMLFTSFQNRSARRVLYRLDNMDPVLSVKVVVSDMKSRVLADVGSRFFPTFPHFLLGETPSLHLFFKELFDGDGYQAHASLISEHPEFVVEHGSMLLKIEDKRLKNPLNVAFQLFPLGLALHEKPDKLARIPADGLGITHRRDDGFKEIRRPLRRELTQRPLSDLKHQLPALLCRASRRAKLAAQAAVNLFELVQHRSAHIGQLLPPRLFGDHGRRSVDLKAQALEPGVRR